MQHYSAQCIAPKSLKWVLITAENTCLSTINCCMQLLHDETWGNGNLNFQSWYLDKTIILNCIIKLSVATFSVVILPILYQSYYTASTVTILFVRKGVRNQEIIWFTIVLSASMNWNCITYKQRNRHPTPSVGLHTAALKEEKTLWRNYAQHQKQV